jgi:hypothetical protein
MLRGPSGSGKASRCRGHLLLRILLMFGFRVENLTVPTFDKDSGFPGIVSQFRALTSMMRGEGGV